MLNFNWDFFRVHRKKIVYSVFVLLLTYGATAAALPAAQTVFLTANASPKKLPIYAVGTEEKKVSVSFDAAWGASQLR